MTLGGVESGIEHDLARYAMQRERAVDRCAILGRGLDARGDELGRRVVVGVEQIAREHRLVPAGIAEVDPGHGYAGSQFRALPVVGIEDQYAGAAGNGTDGFREARVIDRECDSRVHRIERVLHRLGSLDAGSDQADRDQEGSSSQLVDRHGTSPGDLPDSRRMLQDTRERKCNDALRSHRERRIQPELW